jgi:hypothetical protein
MKTKQGGASFWAMLRKILRRRVTRHDPMLLLNMSIFNFTGGWRRTLLKYEYIRSSA